jgi:hypothetical protein
MSKNRLQNRLQVLAAGAAALFAVVAQADAGCCPTCGCAAVAVGPAAAIEPMIVVNRGPQYSGPGHYLSGEGPFVTEVPQPRPGPGAYPYVGWVFTGYPYGQYNSGGYPRGAYSPFTGYPYAEPGPPDVYRRHHVR